MSEGRRDQCEAPSDPKFPDCSGKVEVRPGAEGGRDQHGGSSVGAMPQTSSVTLWGSLWVGPALAPALDFSKTAPDLGLSCIPPGPKVLPLPLCPDLALFRQGHPLSGPGRWWSSLALPEVLTGQDRVLGP